MILLDILWATAFEDGGSAIEPVHSRSGYGRPFLSVRIRLLRTIAEPVEGGENDLQLSAGIGVALFPENGKR